MSDEQTPASVFPMPVSSERVNVGYIPVPPLDRLMELRDALVALKGPLANDPLVRENVHKLLVNAENQERVLGKVSTPVAQLTRLGD
ncbi:type VI secretion system contractile sheath small subunit [Pseudomonas sp. 15FMM2]|uniref:Type VI secretion system contractile sheath small subunit n=1 Tax=Pseudomonas imrae TaxID=2992837 RepID=A0ACC7PH45_9PSED